MLVLVFHGTGSGKVVGSYTHYTAGVGVLQVPLWHVAGNHSQQISGVGVSYVLLGQVAESRGLHIAGTGVKKAPL